MVVILCSSNSKGRANMPLSRWEWHAVLPTKTVPDSGRKVISSIRNRGRRSTLMLPTWTGSYANVRGSIFRLLNFVIKQLYSELGRLVFYPCIWSDTFHRFLSSFLHRGKNDIACLIQAWQSFLVTLFTDSQIRSLNRSSVFSAFLLMPAFTFDQNSSIGFRNGEYGGKYKHL